MAKDYGLALVAGTSGIAKENLYRSLAEDGNPTAKTLDKILRALGLQLSVTKLAESVTAGAESLSGLATERPLVDEVTGTLMSTSMEGILNALINSAEILTCFERVAARLRANALPNTPWVAWPGGSGSGTLTTYWQPEHRFWALAERFDGGMWFGFGTEEPQDGRAIAPEVQLSLSDGGTNRRKAGLFVRAEDGRRLMAHKGEFTVYQQRTSAADYIQSHPNQRYGLVQWPDDVHRTYIVVGDIEDENLLARIGDFVREVRAYKENLRAN